MNNFSERERHYLKTMTGKIRDYQKARSDFLKLVDGFPINQRERRLFDEWSFKDMLTHLWGWSKHQIEILDLIKRGKAIASGIPSQLVQV